MSARPPQIRPDPALVAPSFAPGLASACEEIGCGAILASDRTWLAVLRPSFARVRTWSWPGSGSIVSPLPSSSRQMTRIGGSGLTP